MHLDNRAWLIWGFAVTVPPIVSRNPWLLLECMIIVAFVRAIVESSSRMRWLLRLAIVFAVLSIHFNVLTVHSGDRVLGTLPGSWPVIGGDLTLNALIYGAISAVAILTIVLAWLTIASHLQWIDLMRQLPDRVAPIAAAGSIAWAWLPAMQTSLRDIRESQISRGMDRRRPRDLPALIVPMLAGGLERAITTTDVLDARGFGGGGSANRPTRGPLLIVVAVTALLAAAYLTIARQPIAAASAATVGLAAGLTGFRSLPKLPPRTQWRHNPWTRADTIVAASSLLAVGVLFGRAGMKSDILSYSTYPTIAVPYADPVAMVVLLMLFAPGAVANRS